MSNHGLWLTAKYLKVKRIVTAVPGMNWFPPSNSPQRGENWPTSPPVGGIEGGATKPGIVGIIIYLGLLLSFWGCTATTLTPEPEPISLTFAFPTFDQAFYDLAAQKFKQDYPHLTIELEPQRADSYAVNVEKFDVLVVSPDVAWELQKQGDILNLDPFIEQDRAFNPSDFYPGSMNLFNYAGKTWAIPTSMDVVVMYYNRDLFDQYGVPYPESDWTWNDFLTIALALSDPEAGVFGYGPTSYSPDRDFVDVLHFIYQHDGRIFDDLSHPTYTTFDDPLTIEALEWYTDLIYEHNVAPTPKQLRALGDVRFGVYRGIQESKIGMWMGAFSERGGKFYWPSEWQMRWGVAPLPQDAQSINQAWADGYVISAQTSYPDIAWQWIMFLSQQMPDRMIPARRSLVESSAYKQKIGYENVEVIRVALENSVLPPPGAMNEFGGALEIFGRAVTRVVNGQAAPLEAMSQAQKEAEAKMTP